MVRSDPSSDLQLSLSQELSTAISAVEKACELCRSVQSNLIFEEIAQKKDSSPVTVADFGAQSVAIYELKRAFPDDLIVAEENARELTTYGGNLFKKRMIKHFEPYLPEITEENLITTINQGSHTGGKEGRFWTLDPIDGTKGFLKKRQYAVALALIENGEVVLGVLGCPNLSINSFEGEERVGTVFYAIKSQGAYMKSMAEDKGVSINVSQVDCVMDANFCESVESSHSSHIDSAKIAEILKVTKEPIRMDSQCKYGVLSRGEASIYLRLPTRADYEEKIWDHAAGYILVEEAGGKVTDCFGRKLDFSLGRTLKDNTGIVGSNGRIHEEVLKAVKEVIF